MQSVLEWIETNAVVEQAAGLAIVFAVSVVVYYTLRRVVIRGVEHLARVSTTRWDDVLHDNHVFDRLAHVPPALVVSYGVKLVPSLHPTLELLIQRVALSLIIVLVARSLGGFLGAVEEIYSEDPAAGQRSIKGYLQLAEIFVYLVTAVLVLATLMDRSPLIFLSGLGAMTAVLLLVFKDTLLGLVASVQIASNDMLRVGDWVEMPQYGADGDVIDIALHTVKIQNWDKTISTVPTSKFIETSFKNWRGMSESGGRRIKRALHLDVNTVRFLEDDEIEQLGQWSLLKDYIAEKRRELEEYNAAEERDPSINADIRRLTNLGTLRAYVLEYLRRHPQIRQDMTLLVRQLAPTPSGVPLEIYCFTSTTNWNDYEAIQADIFDHVYAVLPDLGLRAFQDVSDHKVA